MGIAAKLVTEGAEELLRAPRTPIEAGGTIRGAEAHTYDITVKDLSTTGCLVETRAVLAMGSVVQIRITGFPQSAARVVRQNPDGYGCEFLRALSLGDLRRSDDPEPSNSPAQRSSLGPILIVVLGAGLAVATTGTWPGIDWLLARLLG